MKLELRTFDEHFEILQQIGAVYFNTHTHKIHQTTKLHFIQTL